MVAAEYTCHTKYLVYLDTLEAEGVTAEERIKGYKN